MSHHSKLSDLTLEALKESLYAAETLISFSKKSDPEIWGTLDNGCLGYPAAILLFSYIETIGCVYTNRSREKSFMVLREPIFESQNISEPNCKSLYGTYRNTLVHNLSLPKHVHLQVDYNNPTSFNVANTGRKNEAVINSINLFALLNLCKRSFEKVKLDFEKKSAVSEIMKNISFKDLQNSDPPFDTTITPSGNCTI